MRFIVFVFGLLIVTFSSVSSAYTAISVSGSHTLSGGEGAAGTSALWNNVGEVDGVELDLVIYVIANTQRGLEFDTEDGNAVVILDVCAFEFLILCVGGTNQEVDLEYRFYKAGTFGTDLQELVTINPRVAFSDIDTRANETLEVDTSLVASYALDSATDLAVSTIDNEFVIVSSRNGGLTDSNLAIRFDFQPTHTIPVTFRKTFWTDRKIGFDGNVDSIFINPTEVQVDFIAPITPTMDSLSTTTTTPTITGTAEVGSTVTVTVAGATYSTTADSNGNWSVDTSSDLPDTGSFSPNTNGRNEVIVTSTDVAGNISAELISNELIIDAMAPAIPTVTNLNSNDSTPLISGTAEEGSTITVVVGGATYSTTADSDGEWTVDTGSDTPVSGSFSPDLNGSNEVEVTSTDLAGNSSVDETSDELTIDTTSPVTPTVNPQLTNDTTPVISGTAEAGSDITVIVAGATYTVTANDDGLWSVDTGVINPDSGSFSPNVNGANDIEVISTDTAGNSSVNDSAGVLQIDTAAPVIVIADNGSGGDGIYNRQESESIIISGSSDAASGSTITVTFTSGITQVTSSAVVQDNGSWQTPSVNLAGILSGDIILTVETEDAAGNSRVISEVLAVDDGLPALQVNAVTSTNDSTPEFSGTTDQAVGTELFIYDDMMNVICVADVVADVPNNTWSCIANNSFGEGTHILSAVISDTAGNVRSVEFSIEIDLDYDDDGIPDSVEGTGDTDGDGIPDFQDTDSDNDGISDADESDSSDTDIDNDGIPNHLDSDSDNDGIPDALESDADTDSDGIPDYLDGDSDNDGISDSAEETNMPELLNSDTDGDGIDDAIDVDQTGGSDDNQDGIDDALAPSDFDGDGIPDYLDIDSDNDGLPEVLENTNIPLLSGNDSDADGIDDVVDVDQTGGEDLNGDGIDDAFTANDSDGNGQPDYLQLDSDSDSIPDGIESHVSGVDSDMDGIDDRFDVDFTGGVDANNDGIDDDIIVDDFDEDGVPNFQDLDSDNDGLLDVIEAGLPDLDENGLADNGEITLSPPNTDGVDGPDYLDLDSNNDGILDNQGSPSEDFDLDNDGQIDDDSNDDTDGDGVPDVIDDEPFEPGVGVDTDGDGVNNDIDLDDDNDGVPDTAEQIDGVDVDSDGDGVINRLDLDSDNDGIPDSIEGPGNSDLDANGDGVVDDFIDSNDDGLTDAVSESVVLTDSDGDGIPDMFDTVNDNVDDSSDNNDDNNNNDDNSNDDSDDDQSGGRAFNADGTGSGDSEGLQTAVRGAGSFDGFGLVMLLSLLLLKNARVYFRNVKRVLPIGCIAVLGSVLYMPNQAYSQSTCTDGDFASCWYVSGGLGMSVLDPEGEFNGWRTVDETSMGYQLKVGYHFKPQWFAEVSYTDAGAARLGNVDPLIPEQLEMSYKVPAVFVGHWFFDPSEQWNVYAKVGTSSINNAVNDSRIAIAEQSSVQLAMGAGVQWRSSSTWFVRAEYDNYSKDAVYAGVAVGMYFGGSDSPAPIPVPVPVYEPVFQPEPEVIPEEEEAMELAEMIELKVECQSLIGTVEGVTFTSNSQQLTEGAKYVLLSAVETLNKFPKLKLDVLAHTDDRGASLYNLRLSQSRAAAIIDFFAEQGVDPLRFTAKGYGETLFIDTNETEEGRERNRRVEFWFDPALSDTLCF